MSVNRPYFVLMARFAFPMRAFRFWNALGTLRGTIRAQEGQARYPTGASTLPNWGKHVAHFLINWYT